MRRIRLLLFIGFAVACSHEASEQYKQFVLLAATVDLPGGAWFELVAPEPLRTTAYHHQVCFLPATPFRLAEDPMGIVDAHGEPVILQVAASGTNGDLELPLAGYQDNRICFGVSDTELKQEFARVRLQASAPIQIHRVEWQSTDK